MFQQEVSVETIKLIKCEMSYGKVSNDFILNIETHFNNDINLKNMT